MSTTEDSKEQAPNRDESDGFTMIELLIVIIVLGVLSAIVVFALGSVTGSSKAAACNADAKEIIVAVQAYDANDAPINISTESLSGPGAIVLGTPSSYDGAGTQASLITTKGYLNAWPTSTDFALSLSTTKAGDVIVYVPATSTSGSSYDTEIPSSGTTAGTGCYQLG